MWGCPMLSSCDVPVTLMSHAVTHQNVETSIWCFPQHHFEGVYGFLDVKYMVSMILCEIPKYNLLLLDKHFPCQNPAK